VLDSDADKGFATWLFVDQPRRSVTIGNKMIADLVRLALLGRVRTNKSLFICDDAQMNVPVNLRCKIH
jgi:hypothetical protein